MAIASKIRARPVRRLLRTSGLKESPAEAGLLTLLGENGLGPILLDCPGLRVGRLGGLGAQVIDDPGPPLVGLARLGFTLPVG